MSIRRMHTPDYQEITVKWEGVEHQIKKAVVQGGESVAWRRFLAVLDHLWKVVTLRAGLIPEGGKIGVLRQLFEGKLPANMKIFGDTEKMDDTHTTDAGVRAFIYRPGADLTNQLHVASFLADRNQDLFEIPLSTRGMLPIAHAVSLVIDKANKKFYFIDTKGQRPDRVKFYEDFPNFNFTGKTCMDLIGELKKTFSALNDYTVESTDSLQAPMDCAFSSFAIVLQLAKMNPENRSLAAAQAEIHQRYKLHVVEELRNRYFSLINHSQERPR